MKIVPEERDVTYMPTELPKILIRKSKLLNDLIIEEFEAEVRGYSQEEILSTLKKLLELSQQNTLVREEQERRSLPPERLPKYVS
jgi:hypothetical protein